MSVFIRVILNMALYALVMHALAATSYAGYMRINSPNPADPMNCPYLQIG